MLEILDIIDESRLLYPPL